MDTINRNYSDKKADIEALQSEDPDAYKQGGKEAAACSGEEYRQEFQNGLAEHEERVTSLPWGEGLGMYGDHHGLLHSHRPKASLIKVNLSSTTPRGADLSRTDLFNTDLRSANLHTADLRGANLEESTLSGADLSDADLTNTNVSGADLRDAELTAGVLADAAVKDTIGLDQLPGNITAAD